ncbi:hypothetical protein KKF84_19545 [Myxococcota bacterium]|nr:hypothetical protein [Myxococcota bacterium]MBU1537518.1 hypothetical protein [Myxococcota bacterium]
MDMQPYSDAAIPDFSWAEDLDTAPLGCDSMDVAIITQHLRALDLNPAEQFSEANFESLMLGMMKSYCLEDQSELLFN